MKLTYHLGQNFGDALNPYVFSRFTPEGFFDDDESTLFLGIGTILGLKSCPAGSKAVVFSSGCAPDDINSYGPLPQIDERYDVICVRGPLSAKALSLPGDSAVADGAFLLQFTEQGEWEKQYEVAFMPHVGSENRFSRFTELCEAAGVHYISPAWEVPEVLKHLKASRTLITEALHGAIVADALRIPWLAVKTQPQVNQFKWEDFCSSLRMPYVPEPLPGLFDGESLRRKVSNHLSERRGIDSGLATRIVSIGFAAKQRWTCERRFVHQLLEMKNSPFHLSSDTVWRGHGQELKQRLEDTISRYV